MNEIKRLLSNLEILVAHNVLSEELKIFAEEYPDVETISDLNELIEEEISYWEE